ncbi:MAG TPA: tetratricopeptide repeat protein [Anaerolineales bacterium]|nr:tetratricopeptide repeat protein [Anaerolineales bacterium]
MTTSDAKATSISSGEEDFPLHFSEWLKRRRQELDLTQEQLAQGASCSVFAIRKMESGERRPSRQLAGMLAQSLEIPAENQPTFIQVARGERSIEYLPALIPSRASLPAEEPRPTTGNLPRSLTPFIGREPELAALGQLLQDPQCSLITIVGPGGIGKTRLAIEATQYVQDFFPDGIWFVPLAPLNSPTLMVPTIADTINFRFQDPADPQTRLLRYLCDKRSLIILDNAEHLLDGAGLFTELLNACPQVKLLVTSRERLNLLSEWVFEIMGLPVPASDRVEQFESYSSVALFLQSARRAFPRFMLDEIERAGIVDICRLVEGMPLAIELAASWLRTLSTAEIAAEIEHNLDFLSTSAPDVPERHHSMRAVFDHSWEMLSADEQQVLCQLSVFRGGFQRQAAEQVTGASLSILSALADRTLLRRSQAQLRGRTVRYDLHELIRQYCAAHLAEDPQAYAAAHERHCAFFLALAETADQELKGPKQLEWLNRLEQELGNLRAALEWTLKSNAAAQPMGELALRLAGALRWFWRMRSHFHEGHNWLVEALRQSSEKTTAGRASALLGMSLILNGLGDLRAARPLAEESVALYRELGDQRGLAEALTITGLTLVWQGEAVLSHARLEEALTLSREAGDRWGEAQVLYRLGSFLSDYGGDRVGPGMLAESAAILEELGESYLFSGVLDSLGVVETSLGDYAAARTHFERSLAVAREIGHPWGIADALTNLGCLFRIQGDYGTAQSHLESAHRIYQEHGRSTWEIDVLCALMENKIAQGDFSSAQLHLQAASNLFKLSENKWLHVLLLYFRGMLAYYQGDAGEAAGLLGETTALTRESQYKPDLARALIALGRVKRTLGEFEQASELILEGLDLFRTLGHKLGMAIALEELAAVCAAQNEGGQATMLFSVAHTLREKLGAPLPPVDSTAYDSAIAANRTQLGETAFKEIWASASVRPFQEVVEGILENYRLNEAEPHQTG